MKLAVLEGGLQITPEHPIRQQGKWVLPSKITHDLTDNPSGEVYCFVLDPPLSVNINDVECVTWGHGLTEEVVSHHYYGTKEIVDDLKAFEGWSKGFIVINKSIPEALIDTYLEQTVEEQDILVKFKHEKLQKQISQELSNDLEE